jgi:hypothetical protein
VLEGYLTVPYQEQKLPHNEVRGCLYTTMTICFKVPAFSCFKVYCKNADYQAEIWSSGLLSTRTCLKFTAVENELCAYKFSCIISAWICQYWIAGVPVLLNALRVLTNRRTGTNCYWNAVKCLRYLVNQFVNIFLIVSLYIPLRAVTCLETY